MVTRQDAETTGVLRQHRGDAELGREVGDGARHGRVAVAGIALEVLIPAVLGEVGVQVVRRLLDAAYDVSVLGERREPVRAKRAQ